MTTTAALLTMVEEAADPELAAWVAANRPRLVKMAATKLGWALKLQGTPRPARRRREHGGVTVNEAINLPRSPGKWVDDVRCKVCGERYERFASSGCNDFTTAHQRLRSRAADSGGGYRSRGAVLWMLKVCKMEQWYEKHMTCGSLWDPVNHRAISIEEMIADGDDDHDLAGESAAAYTPDDEFGF